MVYEWKSASRIRANAQAAGELFEELERTEGLTARTVLNASRGEGTLLHGEFEWDDGKAAELYREDQAGHLIRSIVIVEEKEEKKSEPVRAYFVTTDAGKYESLHTIMKAPEKTDVLIRNALSELKAFRKKYAGIEELAKIMDVIDGLDQVKMEAGEKIL